MRDKTVTAILAHAAASFPEECCGVVIQKGRVEKYIPCKIRLNRRLSSLNLTLRIMPQPKSRAQ